MCIAGGVVSDRRTVTVATLTFRRPDELRRLLPHLVAQAAEISPPARVLVVDNDPDAGAAAEVALWVHAGVTYVHEPRPGIAAARNHALDAAGDADAIVFIDDDETPADGWLVNLVAQWRAEGSAAVCGPAIKKIDGEIDPWVTSTGLFERWHFPTGTRVQGGASNNLLLDLAELRRYGLRFDERFGLSGGSDTLLIRSLLHRGAEIVWCDEAQVFDPLPANRLTRQWVLKRYFRTGNTWVRVALAVNEGSGRRLFTRPRQAAIAFASLWYGALRFVLGVLTRRLPMRAQGLCRMTSACGGLLACCGYVYGEYARERSSRRRGRPATADVAVKTDGATRGQS